MNREGAIAERLLEDGREVVIYQMIFTWRLVVGRCGVGWYDDAWCFDSIADALQAFAEWDGAGEPQGWGPSSAQRTTSATRRSGTRVRRDVTALVHQGYGYRLWCMWSPALVGGGGVGLL